MNKEFVEKNERKENEAQPMKTMRPVKVIQDDDCHWYVIPADMAQTFYELLEAGEQDEYVKFNDTFGEYRTGGDLNLIQLYAVL